MTRLGVSGRFRMAHLGPDGRLHWQVEIPNGTTVEGANYLLDAGFRGQARFTAWYLGLIDNAAFSALSSADTHASHPGWAEFTAVAGGLRTAWNLPVAASGGRVENTVQAQVPVAADGFVRGAFVASREAVGTAAGQVLYSQAEHSGGGLSVFAGGVVRVTYQIRLRPQAG